MANKTSSRKQLFNWKKIVIHMPTVSVIIPTWNRVKETDRAIRSVLRQTYQDFEIIIADDGSTDQTEYVFSSYPDKRVKYMRLAHTGLPAAARNAALHQAIGDWVAFLDSDDTWLPKKLSSQMDYLDSHPIVKLVCTNAYIYNSGKNKGLFFRSNNSIADTLESLIDHSNFIITSSVLTRRDLLLEYGGFSEAISNRGIEDFDLWAQLCNEYSFHYINQPLVNYSDNQNQSIRSDVSNLNYQIGMLKIYERTLQLQLEQKKNSNSLERLLVRRIYQLRRSLGDWCIIPNSEVIFKDPEVSIILPVYNGEKFILESVFSILDQTYRNFELIIINDGSTDHTAQLLASISDARVVIHHQKNQGIVASLNTGIALARGEYIARQDHDDIALPSRIEKQLIFLEINPDVGLIGTRAEVWGEDNVRIRELDLPISDFALKVKLLFDNPFVHSSIMIRKAILNTVGTYNPDFASSAMEDYDLWSRVSGICKIANLEEQLQIYRDVTTSITKTKKNNFQFRKIISFRNIRTWINNEYEYSIVSHLTALAVGDKEHSDPNLCFLECQTFLTETICKIWMSESRNYNFPTSEIALFINQLRRTHFSFRMHLPWRVIFRIESKTSLSFLNLFEKWEKALPNSFRVFSKFITKFYEFFSRSMKKSVD